VRGLLGGQPEVQASGLYDVTQTAMVADVLEIDVVTGTTPGSLSGRAGPLCHCNYPRDQVEIFFMVSKSTRGDWNNPERTLIKAGSRPVPMSGV
jgi:hypothetical protein